MKKIIYLAILFLLSTSAICQNWQWAKHIGSPYQFYGERGYVISDGINLYVIGSFGGALYFTNDTLFSSGNNDIFIAKFDATGNELWSNKLGGNYTQPDYLEDAKGVYDPICNCIYIAGTFKNTINFGTGISLTSSGSATDNFLARMDLNGNFAWAKRLGGAGKENAPVININSLGKVYLLTQMEDSAYFDAFHVGPGGTLAQYDSLGNCVWAEHKFTAPVSGNTNGVYIDFMESDLILYGTFSSVPFVIDTSTLINQGNRDIFISRSDSVGNIKWINTYGNTGIDYLPASGLSVDNDYNLYVTGGFEDSINYGGNMLYSSTFDIVIVKFDSSGNFIWNKQFYANGNLQSGNTILSDGDGNCYVSGLFSGSATFGTFNVSTSNTNDMFIARYNSSGDCLGVRHFGQASNQALCTDNSGNVYVSGAFYNTINIGTSTFTSYMGQDIYLAKIDEIVGLEEGNGRMENNQLLIYSNPNSGKFTITIPDDFLNERTLVLQIHDNAGKLIRNQYIELKSESAHLNLEAHPTGVYIINMSNGKKIYTGKVVVQ